VHQHTCTAECGCHAAVATVSAEKLQDNDAKLRDDLHHYPITSVTT